MAHCSHQTPQPPIQAQALPLQRRLVGPSGTPLRKASLLLAGLPLAFAEEKLACISQILSQELNPSSKQKTRPGNHPLEKTKWVEGREPIRRPPTRAQCQGLPFMTRDKESQSLRSSLLFFLFSLFGNEVRHAPSPCNSFPLWSQPAPRLPQEMVKQKNFP